MTNFRPPCTHERLAVTRAVIPLIHWATRMLPPYSGYGRPTRNHEGATDDGKHHCQPGRDVVLHIAKTGLCLTRPSAVRATAPSVVLGRYVPLAACSSQVAKWGIGSLSRKKLL